MISKQYFYIILLLLFIILFGGCDTSINNQNTNRIAKSAIDSINKISERSLLDSILCKVSSKKIKDAEIKILSYYMIGSANYNEESITKLVLKQEIQFFQQGILKKKVNIPVKRIKVQKNDGKTILIQENNIYSIGLIETEKKTFYFLLGGGVLDSQTEYYGIYSLEGKVLYYSYTSYQNVKKIHKGIPHKVFGNIDKVAKKFGIRDSSLEKFEEVLRIDLY